MNTIYDVYNLEISFWSFSTGLEVNDYALGFAGKLLKQQRKYPSLTKRIIP